jgi:hypothetical protein
MAGIGQVVVDERKLYQELTVTVTVRRDWRCRLGLWLVSVAGWLCGFEVAKQEGES